MNPPVELHFVQLSGFTTKVKDIFIKTGKNMPTLERDNNLIDIDPFTIFGLFNKKSKDENRIQILKTKKIFLK